MSKGLERYKVILRFLRVLTRPLTALENQFSVPGSQFPEKTGLELSPTCGTESRCRSGSCFKNLLKEFAASQSRLRPTENRELLS
jgi:hypothetical protein